MIEHAISQLLPDSTRKTLETMFFATPDKVSVDSRRPDGALIGASLTFHGSPPGRFGLLISALLARTLAGNFIGFDESGLLSIQVTSVVGELANMICGAAVSQLETDAHFDLSSPVAMNVGADEPGPDFSAGSPSVCRFEFPEGTLVCFLACEGQF